MCLAVPENAQAVAFRAVENVDEQRGGSGGESLEGTVLAGRYRVARVVSTGANTVIMDGIDQRNDNEVTLKIVRPEHAQDPEFRRKFTRLAEISNALSHPNIASVSDWGETELRGESTVFWVVDALGGGSLRDLLDRGRLLQPGQALVIGLETCRALDAAHQKGLFHTELTPSKMVFGADRRLRVIDFGMARLLAEPAWADASALPTHVARYASPEQALGSPTDSKTDVYALALVMIEAVTGAVPFAADSTVATLSGRVDKLLPVSADLGSLASVLERAGRPDSPDRFTAAEFGRALVQAAPGLPKPEPIPILFTGTFDTTAMRRPTDPTGGVERPAPVAGLAGVDETGTSAVTGAAVVAGAAAGAVEAGAAAQTFAAVVPGADVGAARSERELDEIPPVEVDADDVAAEDCAEPDNESDGIGIVVTGQEAAGPESVGPEKAKLEIAEEVEPTIAEDLDAADGEVAAVVVGEVATSDELPIADELAAGDEPLSEPKPEISEVAEVATHAVPSAGPDTDALAATTALPAVHADAEGVASGEIYDEEAGRRRRGPVILLIMLLLAGLAALGYAGSLLLQTKSFEVPVLAGVPEDEALNQIAGNGWEIDTLRERSDTFPEFDTVIRTRPGPGIELDEGEPFTLVLSNGPEFRTLPELEALPFDAAIAELAGLGLSGVEAPERLFSETVAPESVIAWQVQGDADGTMQAGAQILPGETIVMTLSMGPEPRIVPDLTGQTVQLATATLADLQLELARDDDLFSDTVPIGQTVSQNPAVGASLERNGTVTIQVSKGPDVVPFPDLTGQTFTDAQTLLTNTGYVIGSLLGTTEGRFVEATIDDADVLPGDLHRRGTPVDLIFL